MQGIAVDLLSTFIKESELDIEDIQKKQEDLSSKSSSLKKSINSSDLNFLTDNLSYEVSATLKLLKKVKAYNTTLNGVLMSYQYQDQASASAISRIKPQS